MAMMCSIHLFQRSRTFSSLQMGDVPATRSLIRSLADTGLQKCGRRRLFQEVPEGHTHCPSLASPTHHCVTLCICIQKPTSHLLVSELQRDYSLLKPDFSSLKIFLIARGANYIKICWKILVGIRHKNVACSCRCLSCHPEQNQGSLCKNKHDPGMFAVSLECVHCAKLDFSKTLTHSPKVVCGHC